MSRLILLVVVFIVIYVLIRAFLKKSETTDSTKASEDMVRCAHCDMHLPKSESIESDGKYFCSEEHRREHAGK
ncbi:MAG: PP0621 family protein [Gallionellaceae bacterium]|jgi:uncharacterized protein